MGQWFAVIVGGVIGAALGALLAALWMRARATRTAERLAGAERERDRLAGELQGARGDLASAQRDAARLQAELEAEKRGAQDKIKLLTEAREALTNQFKTLSQEILEDKSKRFTEQNRENMEHLLKPLGEKISGFEKQVRESYRQEGKERSALAQQIKHLEALNRQIAEDAVNLTQALKGESKTQGNWGEMILETVLERSGLLKGQHYETQFSSTSEQGRRQLPDAVIHLPEGRSIVVDSKVSLVAYLRLQEAEDEPARRSHLKAHLDSVRTHLKQLSSKDYHQLPAVQTLDYVFMFIPSEAAYVEALRGDFSLQREALEMNIAIVSPTTLMPMLRAIANLWKLQSQEENAAEIARRAGQMYDKFKAFLDDMDKLDRGLQSAVSAYADARRKLVDGRGNLVRRSEQLRTLGAAASKRIEQGWRSAAALESDDPDADEASDDASA